MATGSHRECMAHDLAADLPEPPTPRLGYRRGAGCGSLKVEAAGDFRLISSQLPPPPTDPGVRGARYLGRCGRAAHGWVLAAVILNSDNSYPVNDSVPATFSGLPPFRAPEQ